MPLVVVYAVSFCAFLALNALSPSLISLLPNDKTQSMSEDPSLLEAARLSHHSLGHPSVIPSAPGVYGPQPSSGPDPTMVVTNENSLRNPHNLWHRDPEARPSSTYSCLVSGMVY